MGWTFAEVRQTNASAERQPIPSRCATTHADATAGLAWLTVLAADERTICQRRLRHPAVRSQQKLALCGSVMLLCDPHTALHIRLNDSRVPRH
jgi:hypothetical protein